MKFARFGVAMLLTVISTLCWSQAPDAKARSAKNTARSISSTDVVRPKVFNLGPIEGQVFVLVRKDSVVEGRYLAEARPTCGVATVQWRELPSIPIASACFIDSNTIDYDRDSRSISLRVFRSDVGGGCRKDFETIRFPLAHLCDFE